MLQDLGSIETPATLDTDICIVGAGAAGITLARALMRPGRDICLLESGGADFEAESEGLNAGEQIGQPYYDLREARLRQFGGTTAIWGGRVAELDDIDFRRRDWLSWSGWPITKAELAPFYGQAQSQLGLNPQSLDATAWEALGAAPPALGAYGLDTAFWQFDECSERFTLAHCADLVRSQHVRVMLHATVVELRTNGAGTAVDRAVVRTPAGAECDVRAGLFVLAAGGLETPRLLLASCKDVPEGLGNGHDLVGRFFMEHPHARGGRIETARPWAVLRLLPRFLRHDGIRYAGVVRPHDDFQRRAAILNSAFTFAVRQPPDGSLTPMMRAYRAAKHRMAPDRFGRRLWRASKHTANRFSELLEPAWPWLQVRLTRRQIYASFRAEQAPNPQSRVTLSRETDALGMPRLVLDWRLNEMDKRTVAEQMAALDRALQGLGLGRAVAESWLADAQRPWVNDALISNHPFGGYHHMGTTRMAATPREGVVDGDCRVHGLANLYVAGSSVFPTSGWANPTLTIIALSLRLAVHLHRFKL